MYQEGKGTPPPQQQWAGSGQQAPVQGYAASNPSQAPTQQKIAMGVPRVWATAEMRQGGQMNRYVNSWSVGAMASCTESPLFCLLSVLCGPCVSYHLRSRALRGDLRQYTCCGGYLPCSGNCCEESCPEFCLCLESFCCFNMSVYSTRFLIQDELGIFNSKCDNCMIATMFFLHELRCICYIMGFFRREFREIAHILHLIEQVIWCSFCACFQTQHKIQLDDRDGLRAPQPDQSGLMAPEQQIMSQSTSP